MQACGPETSLPMIPVVRFRITPGQAERIASQTAAATSGSQLGR